MRVYREDIKNWFQNKTDGGVTTFNSTECVDIKIPTYEDGYLEGFDYALDLAKDLMYHVYGLDPDSSTWDGLGKRGK